MQFYQRNSELIIQKGWDYAESYTFTADDYETATEITRSTPEWLNMGYGQIGHQEAEKMFSDAGFSEVPYEF